MDVLPCICDWRSLERVASLMVQFTSSVKCWMNQFSLSLGIILIYVKGFVVRPMRPGIKKRWRLAGNGQFSVKSFYNFLIDGGLRCQDVKFFLHSWCPKKVNLLNWLAWKNKLLSLERLVQRGCNRLPTDTCVLCCAGTESIDHLFVHCAFC